MEENWFLALDGDDIGRRLELHMVTEDAQGLENFTYSFNSVISTLKESILSQPHARLLLHGGDSILISLPKDSIAETIKRVHSATEGSEFTFSGGYGRNMRGAYLALKLAKVSGKNSFSCFPEEGS